MSRGHNRPSHRENVTRHVGTQGWNAGPLTISLGSFHTSPRTCVSLKGKVHHGMTRLGSILWGKGCCCSRADWCDRKPSRILFPSWFAQIDSCGRQVSLFRLMEPNMKHRVSPHILAHLYSLVQTVSLTASWTPAFSGVSLVVTSHLRSLRKWGNFLFSPCVGPKLSSC